MNVTKCNKIKEKDEWETGGRHMICLKIKEILDKAYGDDIITNVTYVTIL